MKNITETQVRKFEELYKHILTEHVEFDNQRVLTPVELCYIMLKHKNLLRIWKNQKKNILVINNVEFILVLIVEFGVCPSRIVYVTDSKAKANYAGAFLKEENILHTNFLEWETDMKFDCVIGNPPYQDGNAVNKIWQHFLKTADRLAEPNGYIAFITPTVWVYRSGSKTRNARKIAEDRGLLYMDLTASRHFPTIGEDICGFVLGKGSEGVHVTHEKGTVVLPYGATIAEIAETNREQLIVSIMKKLEESNDLRLPVRRDTQSRPNIELPLGNMSNQETAEFKYKLHHTASQQYYVKTPCGDIEKLKVMINLSGHYFHHENPDKYIFISRDISGKGMVHVLVNNKTEGNRLITILRSKLFRFYIENEKTSGFTTGIYKLPLLTLTRTWTDEELYEHFGLTQEEIDYIEATVK